MILLKIFLFIAVIDTKSGLFSERVGSCYENIGDLHSAKYWYGKAVKENPTIEPYVRARERLKHVNIDLLLRPEIVHQITCPGFCKATCPAWTRGMIGSGEFVDRAIPGERRFRRRDCVRSNVVSGTNSKRFSKRRHAFHWGTHDFDSGGPAGFHHPVRGRARADRALSGDLHAGDDAQRIRADPPQRDLGRDRPRLQPRRALPCRSPAPSCTPRPSSIA